MIPRTAANLKQNEKQKNRGFTVFKHQPDWQDLKRAVHKHKPQRIEETV